MASWVLGSGLSRADRNACEDCQACVPTRGETFGQAGGSAATVAHVGVFGCLLALEMVGRSHLLGRSSGCAAGQQAASGWAVASEWKWSAVAGKLEPRQSRSGERPLKLLLPLRLLSVGHGHSSEAVLGG